MSLPSTTRLVLVALLAAAAALLATPAHAVAGPAAHVRCAPIEATGSGQDLGNGQTTATVSVDDAVVGSTRATFTITGSEGTTVFFEGPITFTGLGGTLTANVSGTLDAATGAFRSTSTSLSGTGTLRVVTGDVTLTGREDLTTGAFTESITGELCRPGGRV